MAASLPPPKTLEQGEDFSKWVSAVEIYMGAINVTSTTQKVNILLHLLGPDTQDILDTLPEEDGTDEYVQLKAKLLKYFKPRVNVVVERHHFHMLTYEGGRVEEYVSRLKKQARKCEFSPEEMEKQIRDKLVVTCPSRKVREGMLKEENLTLNKAIQLWATDVTVRDQVKAMEREDVHTEEAVNKVWSKEKMKKESYRRKERPMDEEKSKRNKEQRKCFRCGKTNHLIKVCKVPSYVKCHACNKKGHLKAACRMSTDYVQDAEAHASDTEDREDDYNFCVYFSETPRARPIKVDMVIDGKTVNMLVDTGSPVTILPYHLMRNGELEEVRCHLTSFTGHPIPVKGRTKVKVEYQGQERSLPALVVSGSKPPLLGRDWLKVIRLNWPELVGSVQSEEEKYPRKSRKEEKEAQRKSKEGHVQEDKRQGRSVQKKLNVKSEWKKDGKEPERKLQERAKQQESEQRDEAQEVMKRHQDLFDGTLGTMKATASLELVEGAKPVFCAARNVPYGLQEAVNTELHRWEDMGVAEKIPESEPTPQWATPLVVVPKKDGTVRLCGDFKVTLNKSLKVPVHPLPKVEDILNTVGPAKYISVVDLSQAYLQMPLSKASQEMCVLNTPIGLMRMLRLPYGVAASPALFQREMDRILQNVEGVKCLLDDILIVGRTREEALKRLDKTLSILEDQGLKLKESKCKLLKEEVSYLGLLIGADGLKTDPRKVKAVLDAPPPTNEKELREFLGAVTFYGRFLKNLSATARPLHGLLKKTSEWKWGKEQENSFETIKRQLASAPVMSHFVTRLETKVITDASPTGLGAVLVQGKEEKPVMFISRSLTDHERNYSQIEREGLCVVWALNRLKQFLYGRRFKIVTDNKPLAQVILPLKQLPALASSRIQRWALKLAEYQYEVEVRRSCQIPVADWLSRLPCSAGNQGLHEEEDEFSVCAIRQVETLQPVTANQIETETRRDPTLSRVVEFIRRGWPEHVEEDLQTYKTKQAELTVERGCILWGMRVVVPVKLRNQVLHELHQGHQGVVKMKQLSRAHVWWPHIDHDIDLKVQSCTSCWEKRPSPVKTSLHPWEYARNPWERIHADFAGPVKGSYYLVVTDSYSKWLEVAKMKVITSSQTIKIMKKLFACWGVPHQLVTDNGTQFVSDEFQRFLKQNGVKHSTTAPYKPSSNGAAERAVGSLKGFLKTSDDVTEFLMAYRNTPHQTTGRTPSELMMGRTARTRLDLMKPNLQDRVRARQQEQVSSFGGRARSMEAGDRVLARDYRSGKRWQEGEVVERQGLKHYIVKVRRHIDQLAPLPTVAPRPTVSRSMEAGEGHQDQPSEMETPTAVLDKQPLEPEPPPEPQEPEPQPPLRRSLRTRKLPVRLDL